MSNLFIHEYVKDTLKEYREKLGDETAEKIGELLLNEVKFLIKKEKSTFSDINGFEELDVVDGAILEQAVKNVGNDLKVVLNDLGKIGL